MRQPKCIVVGTDFSDGSIAAIEQAVRLSKLAGANLHIVHAVRHEMAAELEHLAPELMPLITEHLKGHAREGLQDVLGEAFDAGDATLHWPIGKPMAELSKLLDDVGADLLVLGSSGKGGRRLGSIAGRCVRQSRVPVLLVPETCRGPFERVLATVDFSEISSQVVEAAAMMANIEGGSCTAMHVYDLPWEQARWSGVPKDSIDLEDELRQLLEKQLKGMAEGAGAERAIECVLKMSHDYASAVISYAASNSTDLIVTGTTGRSALGYLVLGTTAERLMRDSDAAVLSVRGS